MLLESKCVTGTSSFLLCPISLQKCCLLGKLKLSLNTGDKKVHPQVEMRTVQSCNSSEQWQKAMEELMVWLCLLSGSSRKGGRGGKVCY